ncbi:MAG TPA: hypothetical protein VK636_02280 [Gemmatimonadaceae bacterium]|nr:hypothetical protein [Gemmatimonadaceae bacterium]
MTRLSFRPIRLAFPAAALMLAAPMLHGQATATASPAVGAFRAVPIAVPADRVHLTTDQVRLILAAHHPAIVNGNSEDNTVTIVLASNGNYLASSASKAVAAGGFARAVPASAGSGGAIGSGSASASAASGGSGGSGGAVAAAAVGGFSGASGTGGQPSAAGAGELRRVGEITLPGIGTIDSDMVHDMFWTNYEAGDLLANAVRVRFVVLVPNAVVR